MITVATSISTGQRRKKIPSRGSQKCLQPKRDMVEASAAVAAVEQASSASSRTRLHITPFNEALLNSYIPANLRAQATSISFHSVQTFPEKQFGYIELPASEAQKLKQKLNGATLRGQKIRIEQAKPEKRSLYATNQEIDMADEERPRKKPKKEKVKDGVLQGVVLEADRTVKRGWTESVAEKKEKKRKGKETAREDKDFKTKAKDKSKSRESSKYTTDSEMLFRTKLPPNVANNLPAKPGKTGKKDKTKEKKGQEGKTVIVHEFEKTQKHAGFLKTGSIDANAKPASEYVDGKGWIDESGSVVQEESVSMTKKSKKRKAENVEQISPTSQDDGPATNGQLTHSAKKKRVSFAAQDERGSPSDAESESLSDSSSELSSSDSSSASESSDSETDSESEESIPESAKEDEQPTETQAASLPSAAADPYAVQSDLVNMYKSVRTGSSIQPVKPLSVDTSFSFFSAGADDDDIEYSAMDEDEQTAPTAMDNPPLTPFTRRDREWRELRSAAPTPDTAAAHKKFDFSSVPPAADQEEDSESEDEVTADAVVPAAKGTSDFPPPTNMPIRVEKKEESEFCKWFWEHRGENNRAWKKRRREAMKMKRARENRRLSRKVI